MCIAVCLLALCAGCAYRITPPECVGDPVTVYLIDHGYHASIALPAQREKRRARSTLQDAANPDADWEGADGLVEFAYGQWNWFALNHDAWYDVFGTLLIPQRGALGRRQHAPFASADELRMRIGAENVWPIVVERDAAKRLRARLDARWNAAATEAIYNDHVSLTLVPDADAYWVGHNCNSVTAEWLAEVGCRVRGSALWAEFEVK